MKDQAIKLLHVDSSNLQENSVTRQFSAEVMAEWLKAYPTSSVEILDLAADAPNHFSTDTLGIRGGELAEPTESQRYENDISQKLISQFLDSDVVVIGCPFYNFSIPTQLKAWIDRLSEVGLTFKNTESGSVGLAVG